MKHPPRRAARESQQSAPLHFSQLARAAHWEGSQVQRPELAPQLMEARNLYVALRYGPRSWGAQLNRSELSRLKFLVNQLKV